MKFAIVTLTKGALKLGERIKEMFPRSSLYTLPKWNSLKEVIKIEETFQDFTGSIFSKYDLLLFIMATGIVVRSIAPFLKHKSEDPAVLVMDEKGEFIISLLSGHLGGANKYAHMLSKKLNATPVITTASDVTGKIAVDTLAQKLNCEIDSFEKAKNITSLIVNNSIVGLISRMNVDIKLPENIIYPVNNEDELEGIIFIDNKKREGNKQDVNLIPKNIVVGTGCRKGISKEHIIDTVKTVFNELNLHVLSIKCFATVDVKKNENCLLELAKYFNVDLKIISREQIKDVEESYDTSEFVKKNIGVGSVCEPCAVLASGKKGEFLMRKSKFKGVTLAIWEEKI